MGMRMGMDRNRSGGETPRLQVQCAEFAITNDELVILLEQKVAKTWVDFILIGKAG